MFPSSGNLLEHLRVMKPLLFIVALLLSPLAFAATNAPPTEKQKQLLEEILRILPRSEPWERWVKATGSPVNLAMSR